MCQHLVADTAEDMSEHPGHCTSVALSNKSGQTPLLYKGKVSTFLKVRPEGLLFTLVVCISLFIYIFILGSLVVPIPVQLPLS